ncbi:hypothetical protein GCM10009839_89660 [Catenulispora yoronensis]|uniref:Uncharacterized protein n=1 Tax=Catenulispora yoronensis TaxID=450799 RepID=A0ABN2VJW4_9ACTN
MGGSVLLDVPAQVVPQMPTIGHVLRLRCTTVTAFVIGAGPVPADHLHSRMRGQPRGQGVAITSGQQVQHAMGFAVDQNSAVDVATPQCEVIDAEHPRSHRRRIGKLHN